MARTQNPNDRQTIQSSYALTRLRAAATEEDELLLRTLFLILWKRRYVILLGAAVGALAGYFVSLTMEKVYEATATVIVMPPRFSTELKPPPRKRPGLLSCYFRISLRTV